MTPFWRGYRCSVLAFYLGWASWLLYGMGHVGFLICDCDTKITGDGEEFNWLGKIAFRGYQRGMEYSYRLQGWIEGGVYCKWLPWGPKNPEPAE